MELDNETLKQIERIKKDSRHGAGEIARMAARVFLHDAEKSRLRKLDKYLLRRKEIGKRLIEARPAMSAIYNTVNQVLNELPDDSSSATAAQARQLTVNKARSIIQTSLEANKQIAHYGSEIIHDRDRIFTHSLSETVYALIREAFSTKPNITVVISPGGDFRAGITLANRLAADGIAVTFIEDAAVGLYIEYTSKVVVGADRILADGRVINATGTSMLAMAAQYAQIPFYVACEKLKFDARQNTGELDLEPRRLDYSGSRLKPSPDVKLRSYTFDITPRELVKGYITETGIMQPEEIVSLMAGAQHISTGQEPD
ncbi:MAG: translation initiation factor eIF-2B [Dehalococcoidaceae bacterium]|nr:translation initiation factor eIF-2B [Dehalococcoidaceae bacterium]